MEHTKTESKLKSAKRIIIVSLIVVLLLTAGFLVGNYFYNFAISSKDNPFETGELSLPEGTELMPGSSFLAADAIEENYLSASEDGLKLYSRSKTNPDSDVWVILAHGYSGDGLTMGSYAEKFYEMGLSILVPDMRGHGKSEGSYRGMGWHDSLDIIDWTYYINDSYPDSEIVLFGVSMGAATVMMSSGEALPGNVKAIVEDCGYSSIYEEFKYQLKELYKLPSFPVLNLAGVVTQLRAGYNFMNEGDSVSQVAKSVTPILFIHGAKDDFVPASMLDKVYEATGAEREKLIVEGAGHAMSADHSPELYWQTVRQFLNKHLGFQLLEDPEAEAA